MMYDTPIDFYEAIADDITQVLIQLVSERGHGKSTSLRTIVDYCKKKHPELMFQIFDLSQSWWHCAPVEHRQHVTIENLNANKIQNITDCVYEIGSLSQEDRRAFVGTVVKQHWDQRYRLKMEDPEELKKLPWVIFVFEESNIYFGSYSLRKNDLFTPVFQDFVSVGRNYKLGAFLVCTAEVGEMSPSLRRRSRKIYGRVESESDLSTIRRRDKNRETKIADLVITMSRFQFIYEGDRVYGPTKIPDIVTHTPQDYEVVPLVQSQPQGSGFDASWWIKFGTGIGITLLAVHWLMNYRW